MNITLSFAQPVDPPHAPTADEREAERLLQAYYGEINWNSGHVKPHAFASGRAILAASPRVQIAALILVMELRPYHWALDGLRNALKARKLPWTAPEIERLLRGGAEQAFYHNSALLVLGTIEAFVQQGNALTPAMDRELRAMRSKLERYGSSNLRQSFARLSELLGEAKAAIPEVGETWADLALADLGSMPPEQQAAWKRLFAHALLCGTGKPTQIWRKAARACMTAIGQEPCREQILRWFAAVTVPQDRDDRPMLSQQNESLLKGLIWMCADYAEPEIARALARLTEVCLKQIPGYGPWAIPAANAAVWSLAEMNCAEAIGQLGRLKSRIAVRITLKQIEKALEFAAQRAGVTKGELEDLAAPTYGFDPKGVRRETYGAYTVAATMTKEGDVTVSWHTHDGTALKAVPAVVKRDHAAEWRGFKADVAAAAGMLSAQKARFDSFYLTQRLWRHEDWCARFLHHPVLGNVARRLIWDFTGLERRTSGIWSDAPGSFVDAEDQPIAWLTPDTQIRLWHPIGLPVDEVLAWRDYVEQHRIVQPFKQAYREVYLLTEAERNTGVYSNRFAGHILKQHQMNALAIIRGWTNQLRLLVDADYAPATRLLPEFGLRAEFWIDGAGDRYGADTNETGTFLYLATDQVRFYPIDSPPNHAHAGGGGYRQTWNRAAVAALPLTEIPPLAFSEVMRDVDLFVGVCSVGNDPAWQDGGPQGRYLDYWTEYSFGGLSGSAQTRREVLQRLLPRLKIAPRCSLTDRFLVVRGDLRTYKIHLGSGNILMEPNDQYLCIVQDRGTGGAAPVDFLPYEGDQRLALILSKAFLLAADTRITDPTITRQLVL